VLLDALQHLAGEAASTVRLGDILGRLVREAQAQGEIRADLDPSEIAHAIVGAYLATLFEWMARAGTALHVGGDGGKHCRYAV
jgi:hypothetical protein